jgi:hypothetical protein
MDIKTYEPGVPCWTELGSPDPESAAAFYGTLFGWEFVENSARGGGYRTALVRGRPVAGLGPFGPELPGWTTFVAVADADKAADAVTAAGGTVLSPPSDVSGAGREAVFADPSGARFAVWQAGGHHGAGISGEAGAYSWGELITDDVDASASFYGSLFGWTVTGREGPLNRREWQLEGRAISGLLPRPPAMAREIPPYWDVYFTVADVAGTAARAVEAGATQLMAPTDIGIAYIAVFLDPQGAVFTVSARLG